MDRKILQALEKPAKYASRETNGNRSPNHQQQPAGRRLEAGWYVEYMVHPNRHHHRNQHAQYAGAAIGEEGGVDEFCQTLFVPGGCELGDITNNRRPDTKIEQAVVARNGENQDPNAIRCVSEAVQYERRKQDTNGYVDSQGEPTGRDVLDDLLFLDLTHGQGQFFSPIDF